MAINYTKIGWDTSKYVNPTNMNQMDDGIKAACDGVDTLDITVVKKAGDTMTGALTINVDATYPLTIKRPTTGAPNLQFANSDGTLGSLAVVPSTGRLNYAPIGGTSQQLAYVSEIPTDYVKLSVPTTQTITTSGAGYSYPLRIKSTLNTLSLIRFDGPDGTEFGRLGVNSSKKPVFYDTADHELLQLDTLKSVVAASTDFANFKTRVAAL